MSTASDAFENEIVTIVSNHIGEELPATLPDWMIKEGIVPCATIVSVDGIGSKSKDNKTDVIIKLSKGEAIKISAKLRNADYFGNYFDALSTKFLTESVGFAPFLIHCSNFSLSITIVEGSVIGSYVPIFSMILPSLATLESATTM